MSEDKFKREERYIVIKRSDLRACPVHRQVDLSLALEHLKPHLPDRECLVIESDWPEYETAWAMIESRVTGKDIPVAMTDKISIGGVSRELLQNLLHCGVTASTITPYVTAQIRELLDAPVIAINQRGEQEVFNDPLYNAESDARSSSKLLEEVLEWFDDGVGRSPEEFRLMRKIGSWLGRSVPNTDDGSDKCAHSYANKIGCPECGELMQKPCACPGCEKPRKGGSLFCSPHQHSDSRLRFIAKTPSPTNEQLAYMMQRDGEQQ